MHIRKQELINMASKYLGSFGEWDYFIASTNGLYADEQAVRDIQRGRYELITEGKTKSGNPFDIFCTGITLDHGLKREINPFDDLDTTYHIHAIGNRQDVNMDELGCVCSFARESQETYKGRKIGLPHENKADDSYPEGFDLDEFRGKYEYDGEKSLPQQRVELYRHFKPVKHMGNTLAGAGVYKGGYKEFVREPEIKGEIPASKWHFCSNADYYQNIYRKLGAMLVPLLNEDVPHNEAAPSIKDIQKLPDNLDDSNAGGLIYDGTEVSYRFPVIIDRNPGEPKTTRWYNFISQTVDWDRMDDIGRTDPFFKGYPELSNIACRIIGEDVYTKYHGRLQSLVNKFILKRAGAYPISGWNGTDEKAATMSV